MFPIADDEVDREFRRATLEVLAWRQGRTRRPGPLMMVAVDPVAGRSVFLPEPGLVVARERRTGSGWRCAVIARRDPSGDVDDAGHIEVNEAEFATREMFLVLDGDCGADMVAMLWLARIWQRWPTSRRWALARQLLVSALVPGTLRLELSAPVLTRAGHATHLLPALVHQIIAGLMVDGFLLLACADSADLTLILALPQEEIL